MYYHGLLETYLIHVICFKTDPNPPKMAILLHIICGYCTLTTPRHDVLRLHPCACVHIHIAIARVSIASLLLRLTYREMRQGRTKLTIRSTPKSEFSHSSFPNLHILYDTILVDTILTSSFQRPFQATQQILFPTFGGLWGLLLLSRLLNWWLNHILTLRSRLWNIWHL